MRILQIVPSFSLVYGGPSQMVRGFSSALAKQGVEITLLTTNTDGDAGQTPLDVPLGQPIQQDNYQVIYFPCSPFRRYKFSLDLLQWLDDHALQYDLAHIHALFSPVSTAAATVARWKHLPYIMRPLGTLDPADLQKKRQLKQIYGWLWEKPNLAGAAAIHFTSQQEAEISHRFGAKTNDLIIPLGVDIPQLPDKGMARQQLGIDRDIPIILFMSRIDRKKGLNLLLPALEKLQATGWDFHFILAGGNPQDPDYETQIQSAIALSSLQQRTTITGFVKGEIKLALLQDADLFVLPSYYENFGIAVAEAMATGTPVVISNGIHIWREIEQGQAGWITDCDIDKLTDALTLALRSPQLRQQRGVNARQLVQQQYNWQAIAKQTVKAYSKIISHSI
ncbi:MAG: hormogonium polysaccharide biosynthesis glycosyltransferase HpsP [Pleurocapsa sp.]